MIKKSDKKFTNLPLPLLPQEVDQKYEKKLPLLPPSFGSSINRVQNSSINLVYFLHNKLARMLLRLVFYWFVRSVKNNYFFPMIFFKKINNLTYIFVQKKIF